MGTGRHRARPARTAHSRRRASSLRAVPQRKVEEKDRRAGAWKTPSGEGGTRRNKETILVQVRQRQSVQGENGWHRRLAGNRGTSEMINFTLGTLIGSGIAVILAISTILS